MHCSPLQSKDWFIARSQAIIALEATGVEVCTNADIKSYLPDSSLILRLSRSCVAPRLCLSLEPPSATLSAQGTRPSTINRHSAICSVDPEYCFPIQPFLKMENMPNIMTASKVLFLVPLLLDHRAVPLVSYPKHRPPSPTCINAGPVTHTYGQSFANTSCPRLSNVSVARGRVVPFYPQASQLLSRSLTMLVRSFLVGTPVVG